MIEYAVGDTKPPMLLQMVRDQRPLVNANSYAFSLKVRRPDGSTVTIPLTLVDEDEAIAQGSFGAGDLNSPGDYVGELIVLQGAVPLEHAREPIPIRVRPEFSA